MAVVRTVLGDVAPGELGVTLCHEHLVIDLQRIFTEPEDPAEKPKAYAPVTLDTLGWVRLNYAQSLDNMGLYDEALVVEELSRFREAGGATLVEVTPVDIGRDPEALARIARAAGLNIVMGNAYYVFGTHPPDMAERPEDDLAEELSRDIAVGVGNTGVRSGIIGEIGCTWPLHKDERKCLRSAAKAQVETGAAITIHPGRDPAAPPEILEVIDGAGGNIGRTIMGHLDRTYHDYATLEAFARLGCYLEFDMFGLESAYYPFGPMDMPNDGRRIDLIMQLIADGYGDRILISHDIAFKHALVKYGGTGYAHILDNAVPKMRTKGMSEDDIKAVMVDNPAAVLGIG